MGLLAQGEMSGASELMDWPPDGVMHHHGCASPGDLHGPGRRGPSPTRPAEHQWPSGSSAVAVRCVYPRSAALSLPAPVWPAPGKSLWPPVRMKTVKE